MSRQKITRTAARGLGWFGIGLGLMEVFAPRRMAKVSGLTGHEKLLRWFGVREIASGVPLLLSANPSPWLWARVVGDGLDGAALMRGMAHAGPRGRRARIATAAVAPIVALDVLFALRSLFRRRH